MAVGSMWKADDKFVVQFSHVKPKEKPVIFNALKGWVQSGSGFHKDGTEIFIFSNKLHNEDKVVSLVKSFPFPFTEEKKNGESKKIRTQHKDKVEAGHLTRSVVRAKIGEGRTCSRCGNKGHNSRTCKK